MITHNFDPVMFDFGFLEIRWYSMAYILGILIGWLYAKKIIRSIKEKHNFLSIDQKDFDELIIYLLFGIIIGGRLGYVFFYDFNLPEISLEPLDTNYCIRTSPKYSIAGLLNSKFDIEDHDKTISDPFAPKSPSHVKPSGASKGANNMDVKNCYN